MTFFSINEDGIVVTGMSELVQICLNYCDIWNRCYVRFGNFLCHPHILGILNEGNMLRYHWHRFWIARAKIRTLGASEVFKENSDRLTLIITIWDPFFIQEHNHLNKSSCIPTTAERFMINPSCSLTTKPCKSAYK